MTGITLEDELMPEESIPASFDLEPEKGNTVTYTYTVTQNDVEAGSFENTVTVTGTDPRDPNSPVVAGASAVVTASEKPVLEVTVTGNTAEVTYDGEEHSVTGYKASCDDKLFDPELVRYDSEAEAKGTEPDTYQMDLDPDKFFYDDESVKVNFTVTDGWLKITKETGGADPVTPDEPSGPADDDEPEDDDEPVEQVRDDLNRRDHYAYILGMSDGLVHPEANITRAEAMALLNRVLDRKLQSTGDMLPGMTEWPDNADPGKWYYLDVQEATNSHRFTRNYGGPEKWTELRETPGWEQYE
ncbi:MAG: hypothetical protein IJM17_06135 [Firmicutes bacterium]|nr:hypothetical protein [Bacillota bacterium]